MVYHVQVLAVWWPEWVTVRSWSKGCWFARFTLPEGLPLNFQVWFFFSSPVLDCLCGTVAAHCAPMNTHDIATKPSPQLTVLRHGALSGFCPIIILMKRLNAIVVGWRVGVGAVWLGGP